MAEARSMQQNQRNTLVDKNLHWYVNRIRTMSVGEIPYRVEQMIQKRWDEKFRVGKFPMVDLDQLPDSILFFPESAGPFNTDHYYIFGRPLDLNSSIDWHYDLISETRFPKKFSYSIDTRTEKHGISKVVWEINRLQFLTRICLAYRYTGDRIYLRRFVDFVESWHRENPYLLGVNWYSNIELSLRIITWFLCWEILDVSTLCERDAGFRSFTESIWLPLLYLHGEHIYRNPSRFSSANNHLIAEAAGLFIVGSYWKFKGSDHWIKYGQDVLNREMQLQHTKDGVNREEASEYIQFITDFFLISLVVGERNGQKFSQNYYDKLHQIFKYISDLSDQSGRVPYYGDDDDGKAFCLTESDHYSNFLSLLVSGCVLFEDSTLKSGSMYYDFKNEVLFGDRGRTAFSNLETNGYHEGGKTLMVRDEGHLVLRSHDEDGEIYLHFDAAPLGYLSIAAHGHADALSIILHVDGIPFIVDVGTYTYHSEPPWRAYFKGTLAHNTIRIDRQDQAANAGPCLWLDHYNSTVNHVEEKDDKIVMSATHDGYEKLGVLHTRSVVFEKSSETFIITDSLDVSNEDQHFYEIPFHLHPEIVVSKVAKSDFELTHPEGRTVDVSLDPILNAELVNGQREPILGWYSGSFLQKRNTNVLFCQLQKTGSFKLTTHIRIR